MGDTNGNIPCGDPIGWHNRLSPIVSKLEFLSRLAPVLDTNEAYGECILLINDMVGDYTAQLRRALDALVANGEGRS
jgi:hypothetical protein